MHGFIDVTFNASKPYHGLLHDSVLLLIVNRKNHPPIQSGNYGQWILVIAKG